MLPLNKEHREFHAVDLLAGWEVPRGYPLGIKQKILAGYLNEPSRCGYRTRLLRFEPGAFTTEPFVHEYWEEVYLISGNLTVGCNADGTGGETFGPNTYACRPPGVLHGPFRSANGCLLLEVHLYEWSSASQ
jgi:hypothetical protein